MCWSVLTGLLSGDFSQWVQSSVPSSGGSVRRSHVPFLSLVICSLVIGGVLLVAGVGGAYWEPVRYTKWLLPWGVQNHLLAPTVGQAALAGGACLAYTAGFLAIGLRTIRRRDL